MAPNKLVYPEIYPECCLYDDCDDLFNRLKNFCLEPSTVVSAREKLQIDFGKYSSVNLVEEYVKIFATDIG